MQSGGHVHENPLSDALREVRARASPAESGGALCVPGVLCDGGHCEAKPSERLILNTAATSSCPTASSCCAAPNVIPSFETWMEDLKVRAREVDGPAIPPLSIAHHVYELFVQSHSDS